MLPETANVHYADQISQYDTDKNIQHWPVLDLLHFCWGRK